MRIPGGGVATEIPDINAQLNLPIGKYAGMDRMGDIYDHPELYAAMPHLENTQVNWALGRPTRGGFSPATGDITAIGRTEQDLKRMLVHEGQHSVQKEADWAHGSSPEIEAQKSDPQVSADAAHIFDAYKGTMPDAMQNMPVEDVLYHHQAGEAQSRMAENRMNMTPDQLATSYPGRQYDVPMDSLLLRYLNSILPVAK
jgi:hypothetical protein